MKEETQEQRIQSYFLGGLLFAIFVLVFLLFQPYITSLLLGFVIALIFHPWYIGLLKKTGNRSVLTSLLMTLLIVLVVIVPISIFSWLVLVQLIHALNNNPSFLQLDQKHLPAVFSDLNINARAYVQNFLSGFINNLGQLFSNLLELFVYIILTVLSMFYFFKDGIKIRDSIYNALPFTKSQTDKLSYDMDIGVRAIIGGYILVAILQGTISGIGFWIFGLPDPALWGFATFIAALIPTFGTSIVNIPAILYLFFNHQTGAAVGLFIWYAIAVVLIDNYIGPRFISGKVNIHLLLIIFSIIGGLKLFGPLGFIMGPLVIILFWSVLEMFHEKGSASAKTS